MTILMVSPGQEVREESVSGGSAPQPPCRRAPGWARYSHAVQDPPDSGLGNLVGNFSLNYFSTKNGHFAETEMVFEKANPSMLLNRTYWRGS